jgi:tRNA U34 5-methylaminomethyl-2-thiouridine-forming methyltransferase MnmC
MTNSERSPEERYELVRLPNGASSVRACAYAETMHPAIGPVAEADALYVGQLRLRERMTAQQGRFVVWDVGLGAAANATAVLRAVRSTAATLHMVSFDNTSGPLAFALGNLDGLPYLRDHAPAMEELLARGTTRFQEGSATVEWTLHVGDFPAIITGPEPLPAPDAILFDPFSPATNPGMWTLAVFSAMHGRLAADRPCSLATYSRSTMTRVALMMAGFFVGAGQASGRKEETTVAANMLSLIDRPLDPRWLERARRSGCAEPLSDAVYRQAPITEQTWESLRRHPQFQ